MNYYRRTLLSQFESRLIQKERKLKDISDLIPDFENLRASETANYERRRLLQAQRNLQNEIAEIKTMIADLKTETDDVTPIE